MKKQALDKLNIFFMGIKGRYNDQKEFFIKTEFTLKSGRKYFDGEYSLSTNEFIFNGDKVKIDFDNMLAKLLNESQFYDSLLFKYIQRGTVVIIEADDNKVVTRNEELKEEIKKDNSNTVRDYYIKASKAEVLLKEIGIMTEDGKIKNDMIRKYNQIDHFVEVIDPILKNFQDKESITILDSACGKSYLTFVLNFYIKEVLRKKCNFIGVDYKTNVIESSIQRANRLGYKNMEFIQEDLRTYIPKQNIDMVISLHACDIATDYAIALALRSKANSLVIVPCCHKELKDQIKSSPIDSLIKHGIFKTRFNDLLTDSLRSLFIESYGYEVTPIEYVSPLDTPKNLMIRAIKKLDYNEKAASEYNKMKELFDVYPTMEKYIF